jgi:hypothetical protein
VKEGLLFWRRLAKDFYFLRQRHVAGHGLDRGSGGEVKVFCFFSSEKKFFALLPCYHITTHPRALP